MKFGDTADVQCAELAIQYEAYLHKKQQEGGEINAPKHSQDELQAMIDRVRETKK